MSRSLILDPSGRRYVRPLGFARDYHLEDDANPPVEPEVYGQLIQQDDGWLRDEGRKREEKTNGK